MQGHVRAGGLRDVDHKDEELNVGLEEDFVGNYRAEEREPGSNCPGMVSRTPKILIQHQTVRQGNLVALSKSVVIQIPREKNILKWQHFY